MDAVKFLRERNRICKGHEECNGCPIRKITKRCDLFGKDVEKIVEVVATVENWSKEHPEEIGKKYIIEIDEGDGYLYRIKGINEWLNKEELGQLEEYKESEE